MDGPRGTIHSATDGPGGPSAVAMDGPGGPIIGGTIHCVTVPLNKTVVILLARIEREKVHVVCSTVSP